MKKTLNFQNPFRFCLVFENLLKTGCSNVSNPFPIADYGDDGLLILARFIHVSFVELSGDGFAGLLGTLVEGVLDASDDEEADD